MLARLSLRARLLLAVVLLAAVGLVAADVATYASLRSFLVDRVDRTLQTAHVQVEHDAFGHDDVGDRSDDGGRGGGPPAQGVDWYQVRTLSGTVVAGGFLVGGGSPPKVDAGLAATDQPSYFTVESGNGSTSYRVRASVEPSVPGRILLIATSLHDVLGTLHRLLLIEVLVTLAALGAIGGLGLWVVRLGLRPLREIEATAATIAAGDLTQRVERAEPKTEVGRLGLSLNAMLAHLESAFAAREASERQLRRFVARAADAARRRARLCRAVRPGRRHASRGPRALDVGHHT